MTTDHVFYANRLSRAWNSHQIDEVLKHYSPEYTGSDVGQPGFQHGHEGVRRTLQTYWGAFPDLKLSITNSVAEGPRLVLVWLAEGTHQGPILNIPATKQRVHVTGVSILGIQDGLVTHCQSIWDMAGFLRKVGLLPEL